MEDVDIGRLRNQLKLLQRRLRREGLPTEGVSRSALLVLAAATVEAGDVHPRELASRLEMTSSNVAAALRELETAGLVIRAKDPLDGRRVRIQVTGQGRAVNARRRSERHSWLGRAISTQLDEHEQQLLRTAGELIERIAGYDGVPPDSGPATPGAAALPDTQCRHRSDGSQLEQNVCRSPQSTPRPRSSSWTCSRASPDAPR